jgi:hypothetical protein
LPDVVAVADPLWITVFPPADTLMFGRSLSSAESACATGVPIVAANPVPMPSATASAPTLPTVLALPIAVSERSGPMKVSFRFEACQRGDVEIVPPNTDLGCRDELPSFSARRMGTT